VLIPTIYAEIVFGGFPETSKYQLVKATFRHQYVPSTNALKVLDIQLWYHFNGGRSCGEVVLAYKNQNSSFRRSFYYSVLDGKVVDVHCIQLEAIVRK